MAVTREEKNATWTEKDAAQYEEATTRMLRLTATANKHFTQEEIMRLKEFTIWMKVTADMFEDEPEHKPIEFTPHTDLSGLRPFMGRGIGIDGTITTPGYNRSRLWDGTTYMSANSDDY